ncbi:MAG: hypothetical protein COA96_04265 [SAR86 cluster bacterium]|uniref:TraB/GumN family protein n=1 Tax=SAR86 cluster bacterium TaxID=2030880 RepID=A0A2A5B6V1_9GAMM|nr:MAG: hypothetical protein COA96_04265 [SAR86 cluster bacterium]
MYLIRNVVILLCSLSASMLIAEDVFATGRYDVEKSTLTIECVEVLSDGNPIGPGGSRVAYKLSLLVSDDQLTILEVQETLIIEDCSAVFETTNNILTTEARVVDDIYDVRLQFDDETDRFALLSTNHSRRGETSLWRVSNGEHELFLGGTIHILRGSDFPLPQSFLDVYQQADTLVFEINPDEVITQSDYSIAYLPSGQSLINLLQPSTVFLVNTYLNTQGKFLLQYDRVKPEFFDAELFYIAAREVGYIDGVDDYFELAARTDGKPMSGLELVYNNLAALDESFDHVYSNVDALLTDSINAIYSDDFKTSINEDIVSWREGNLAEFTAKNIARKLEDPVFYEAILSGRNRSWIPILEQHLTSDAVEFVLAGVSHFAGPDNVIQLLEELGYTVERYLP